MDLYSEIENSMQFITVNAARIDAAVAIQFKDAMRAVTDGGMDHVILDLSQVAFVDSSGLGAIVAAMKQLGKGRQLDLVGLTSDVGKVFQLTRMDTVFKIHQSIDQIKVRVAGQ